jgi:hypothetical protein
VEAICFGFSIRILQETFAKIPENFTHLLLQWQAKMVDELSIRKKNCDSRIQVRKKMVFPITYIRVRINYTIEIINNKARHNLMDAKCRWRFDRLDGAVSFREPLGQTKVMQIRQRETLNHHGAITHEVCCLAAQ